MNMSCIYSYLIFRDLFIVDDFKLFEQTPDFDIIHESDIPLTSFSKVLQQDDGYQGSQELIIRGDKRIYE